MPKTIENVPNEILKHILVQVREQCGFNSLKNALLVSHLWNAAGTPVLYEHVVLHNGNISSFLDTTVDPPVESWSLIPKFQFMFYNGSRASARDASSTFEEAKAMFSKSLPSIEELKARKGKKRIRDRERSWGQVHTLTLNVKPEGTGNTRYEQQNRQEAGKLTPLDVQLMRLASMLPKHFPLLNTFSFFAEEVYFHDKLKMEREGPGFLDVRVIHELVGALPESCINLFLDTNGREIQFGPSSPRMCLLIQNMMLRLRHLNLRAAYVCGSIIELPAKDEDDDEEEVEYVKAPYLRSLSISFVPRNIPYWFDLMYARNVCKQTHSHSITARLPNDHPLGSNSESRTIRLTEALGEALNRGCFPHTKSIQVITPMRINRRGKAWSERENDEMIIIRDLVKDKTHALQFIPANSMYVHDEDRALIGRHGVFAMGNHQKLKMSAEDSMWDATAKYGARLPIDTPDIQFQKCTLKTLSTKRELKYFVDGLKRETHEKMKVLHRDLTEGERHPGREFEFEGASFPFKDFMPENF